MQRQLHLPWWKLERRVVGIGTVDVGPWKEMWDRGNRGIDYGIVSGYEEAASVLSWFGAMLGGRVAVDKHGVEDSEIEKVWVGGAFKA